MAARLEKEEKSAVGHGEERSTQVFAMDTSGELVGNISESVPSLLQNVDERTNDRPWWMDDKVVASIEAAEKPPGQELEPEAELELEGANPEKLNESVVEDAAANAVHDTPQGGNVREKAAALEKEEAEPEEDKAKGGRGKKSKGGR